MSTAQLVAWVLILLIRQAIRSGFARGVVASIILAWFLV